MPNLRAIDLVHRGKIGQIREVIAANYASPWECSLPAQPIPADLDWDQWCGPTELAPYHPDIFTPRAKPGWISFRPWSGGEMTGWGAHGLDQIQWALGMDASGPTEIWTEGPRFDPPVYREPESRRRGEQACQQPSVVFRYAQGVVVRLRDGDPGGGTLIGDAGSMRISRGGYKVVGGEAAVAAQPASGVDTVSHLQHWFHAIRSRTPPNADVEIGHRTATVCHLGNIARWTGRKLRWDPARETFLDDDAANALLDRPRRAGYALPELT